MGDLDGMSNLEGGLCSMYSMRLKLFVHPGGNVSATHTLEPTLTLRTLLFLFSRKFSIGHVAPDQKHRSKKVNKRDY